MSPYKCHSYSDLFYLKIGIERCLSQTRSGRDFIQELGDSKNLELTVSHFFKSLKSKRRLKNQISVNDLLAHTIQQAIHDPFKQYKEMKDWEVYAVDGHYQEHATHDPIFTRREKESRPATGQFFRLNLRSHHLSLLDTMQPEPSRKKEHDAKVIQRMYADELRYHAQ